MTLTRLVRTAIVTLMALSPAEVAAQTPAAASAQQPPSSGPAAQTPVQPPSPPPVTAGWRDGFLLQTDTGDYRLQLGMVTQADGRFVLDDAAEALVDTFSIRKMRPVFSGRIARYFDFQVVPDFGNGVAVLQDAYFEVRFSPAFRVRAGKSKTPIGYELLISDPFLLFPERAVASSLVPNRDVGVQVLGELAAGRFAYQAGVFNGVPDGTSSTVDLDTNDSKDLAGRIVVQPFRAASGGGALSGLGGAVGASAGRQIGALPAFRTSVGQRYFAYDVGAAADGMRHRVSPAVFYYYNALGVFAEYMRSSQPVIRGGVRRDIINEGWDVTGSVLLTGEPATDRGVRPRYNFDPPTGRWGAVQLVGRYSELTLDDQLALLAAANSSDKATQVSVGLNWYPAPVVKYYLSYERIRFESDAEERPDEHSVILRAQIAF